MAWPSTVEWVHDRLARSAYPALSEEALRGTRRSDTVFIFGSGKSLLDITPEEWAGFAKHDTIGFNQFLRQEHVRVDYHMVGEVNNLEEYAGFLRANPCYERTILILQEGWRAEKSNALVGRRLLRPGTTIFRYRRRARGRYEPPSRSFRHGLVHGWNTSISLTNFAALTGWRRIVLTGIDLYNREYFWMPWGERRLDDPLHVDTRDQFPSLRLIVEVFGRWRPLLEEQGISLEVYSPTSALADVLPLFDRDTL